MKTSDVRKRLRPNRPMTSVTLRMPEDVVEDLKRLAPLLGFSGYQPLMRHYIGQGLRADLARLEDPSLLGRVLDSLKRHGVDDGVIADVMADAAPSAPGGAAVRETVSPMVKSGRAPAGLD